MELNLKARSRMKDLLVEANVPTAKHGTFTNEDEAIAFLSDMPLPYVIKHDGLAAGKGVIVTESVNEQKTLSKLPFRRRLWRCRKNSSYRGRTHRKRNINTSYL